MVIVPTIKITTDEKEIIKTLKIFNKYNIDTYRFVVTKASFEEHIDFINKVKEIYKTISNHSIKLMLDIPCPKDKLRLDFFNKSDKIELLKDEQILIVNNKNNYSEDYKCFFINDSFVNKNKGTAIIGDNELIVDIEIISKDYIVAKCKNNATLVSGKGIAANYGFLKVTDEDITKKVLRIIKTLKPDICVLSYIESKEDIINFKQKIIKSANYSPQIMSKVECKMALDNINEIIEYSDSLMIARGCLAVNIGLEQLTIAQDQILKICDKKSKKVCIASNILRSLGTQNNPSRADVCDVSHMIINGANYFVVTDGFCMSEKFDTFMNYIEKIYNIYN